MRLATAALLLAVTTAAGCGGRDRAAPVTTVEAARAAPAPAGPRIAVVGPLAVQVQGADVVHGRLSSLPRARLVLVSSGSASAERLAGIAAAHPGVRFALVGASTKGFRRPNLTGLVLRDDRAAQIAGIVAGVVVDDEGATAPRVAWVGPEERPLARAFLRGVRSRAPHTTLLRAWSRNVPARCKEAALAAIDRGALVVVAHEGLCARAALAAAGEQNVVGMELGDFELPSVAASTAAEEELAGVFHGGEDVVFGARSGAVGIRRLDPRIGQTTAVRARAAVQEFVSGLRP